jgi:hypothetical protein
LLMESPVILCHACLPPAFFCKLVPGPKTSLILTEAEGGQGKREKEIIIYQYLLCTKHCVGSFLAIDSFNPQYSPSR